MLKYLLDLNNPLAVARTALSVALLSLCIVVVLALSNVRSQNALFSVVRATLPSTLSGTVIAVERDSITIRVSVVSPTPPAREIDYKVRVTNTTRVVKQGTPKDGAVLKKEYDAYTKAGGGSQPPSPTNDTIIRLSDIAIGESVVVTLEDPRASNPVALSIQVPMTVWPNQVVPATPVDVSAISSVPPPLIGVE